MKTLALERILDFLEVGTLKIVFGLRLEPRVHALYYVQPQRLHAELSGELTSGLQGVPHPFYLVIIGNLVVIQELLQQ